MTDRVVELLEAIEVEQDEGELGPAAGSASELAAELGVERPPVRQVRQLIGGRGGLEPADQPDDPGPQRQDQEAHPERGGNPVDPLLDRSRRCFDRDRRRVERRDPAGLHQRP